MNIQLDPVQQKRLEDLAKRQGKGPAELAHQLLSEAIAAKEAKSSETEEVEAHAQVKEWESLFQELDRLPKVEHKDGLSGSRDHDEILYGRRS